MRRWALAAVLSASCAPPAPVPSCAIPSASFLTLRQAMEGAIPIVPPHRNVVWIGRDGVISWNGAALGGLRDRSDFDLLGQYLEITAAMPIVPYVALDFDRGTPCAPIVRVRALIDRHLRCADSRRCVQGSTALLDGSGNGT